MKDANTPAKKVGFRKWLKSSLIQEGPPELYACEVCGQYECDNERWLNCQHRLKVCEQMRSLEATDEGGKPEKPSRCPEQSDKSE